jgi:hypothetical protein
VDLGHLHAQALEGLGQPEEEQTTGALQKQHMPLAGRN